MGRTVDLTGERFGRLQVVTMSQDDKKRSSWVCLCDCGTKKVVIAHNLRNGHTKSCGCYSREQSSVRAKRQHEAGWKTKHGDSKSRLYRIWKQMTQRCGNPKNPKYYIYGDRNIKVDESWKKYETFKQWAEENGYADNLTIDRFPDKNGDYTPSNCRWADYFEQNRNLNISKRNTSGYPGVWWNEKRAKWEVAIKAYNKKYFIGRFLNKDDAIDARKKAELRLWGSI